MADPRPPLPVRVLAAVIPRLPLGRYWAVSQLRRFRPTPFMMPLPRRFGALLYECDPRDSVAREVCYTGGYEPQETAVAERILRPGDRFVDVGANWGYFSLAAAHWVGPRGRVVAFEPEPRLYRALGDNVAANRLTHVSAHRAAVAAGPGRLAFAAFREDEGNWGISRAVSGNAAADFEVQSVGLDAALDAERLGEVQLVKIDVEGGEAGVLAGMTSGLARGRYRHVLLECHPALLAARGESASACVDQLTGAGYRAWVIDHSPAAHRRAARNPAAIAALLRPYEAGAQLEAWPHVLALAPGVPELA